MKSPICLLIILSFLLSISLGVHICPLSHRGAAYYLHPNPLNCSPYDHNCPDRYDCLQLVLRAGPEHAFLVVKRSVKRAARLMGIKIPHSDILYCSDPSLLARHLGWAKLAIMWRQRTLFLFADERIFPVRPRGVPFEALQFYRSPRFVAADLDKLYSELVLLPL